MVTDKKFCRIGICEDDEQYRKFLVNIIRKSYTREDSIRIYFFPDGASLFSFSEWKELDILFMDVDLPDGNGHIFAEKFREQNQKAIIDFCTNIGFPQADIFKINVFRYIRKDAGTDKIEYQVAETLAEYHSQRKYENFITSHKEISLEINDILYCEKQKRGTKIYLTNHSEITVSEHLDSIYKRICKYGFSWPHDSYIVNMRYIARVNRKKVMLPDGGELSIASKKWKLFQEDFKKYICT